jgi:hypothetical protein
MALWWLSFVDPHRPEGTRFLGVALVEAETMADALRRAWRSGCNPGGEVEAYELPLDKLTTRGRLRLARAPRHVLLDADDLAHFDLA